MSTDLRTYQDELESASEYLLQTTDRQSASMLDLESAFARWRAAYYALRCRRLMATMADMATEVDQLKAQLLAEQASHATTRARLEQSRSSTNSHAHPIDVSKS